MLAAHEVKPTSTAISISRVLLVEWFQLTDWFFIECNRIIETLNKVSDILIDWVSFQILGISEFLESILRIVVRDMGIGDYFLFEKPRFLHCETFKFKFDADTVCIIRS